MNLPAIVTNAALQKLADPGDTHEVHVIVRRIANAAPYTLRGRRRQYIVTRCQVRGAHILKVPLSLWMGDCRADKPVMENDSICYDLQGSRTGLKSPLTFEVWPVGETPAPPVYDREVHADAIVQGAIAYTTGHTPKANPFTVDDEADRHAAWLQGFETADSLSLPPHLKAPAPLSTDPAPLSNKERQAAYRARKRAEKEAAEAAKLQEA